MGKQISFFMSPNDEENFFEEITENNDILILKSEMDRSKIQVIDYEVFLKEYKVYIATKMSKFEERSSSHVNDLTSDVIEFIRSKSWEPLKLNPGRLWVELSYWINEAEIRKKPDWLNKLYEQYGKWIKKNYRISKNKCYYIGDDAYRMYKEEGWQMMGGPIVEIEF